MTVDYIYQFSLVLMRKMQAGGLSATQFGYHWNDTQRSYMSVLLGPYQKRVGVGLVQNQTTLGKLSPFIRQASATITSGVATKPTGYIYGLSIAVGDYGAEPLTFSQFSAAKRSTIDPASSTKFYVADFSGSLIFLPATYSGTATLTYVKEPTNIVWAYTLDGDSRQVYDATNSVQPEWDGLSCSEITKQMFRTLGVSFKDSDFANFGQSVIAQGT